MKRHVLLFLMLLVADRVASAQLLSIGAKAGIPFLQPNQGGDESRRYIVGPSVEFRLPAGFAVELDALYRRVGNTSFFGLSGNAVIVPPLTAPYITFFLNRQRGNYWEFPLLAKYYFRPRTTAWQPFLGTGWAFRTVGFHEDISETVIDANGNSHANSFRLHSRSDLGAGAVFAAGVRFRAGRVAVIPELRYTYWGSVVQFQLRRNEAAGLLGISF